LKLIDAPIISFISLHYNYAISCVYVAFTWHLHFLSCKT